MSFIATGFCGGLTREAGMDYATTKPRVFDIINEQLGESMKYMANIKISYRLICGEHKWLKEYGIAIVPTFLL